jgi:hypothetical protein
VRAIWLRQRIGQLKAELSLLLVLAITAGFLAVGFRFLLWILGLCAFRFGSCPAEGILTAKLAMGS